MSSAKLIVAYPQPVDIDAVEKLYAEEHVPLAVAKLVGKTKMVATKIIASPQGKPQFYRVAEVHFPSRKVLEECAASAGGKETLANAVKISSGGPPVIMIALEDSASRSSLEAAPMPTNWGPGSKSVEIYSKDRFWASWGKKLVRRIPLALSLPEIPAYNTVFTPCLAA